MQGKVEGLTEGYTAEFTNVYLVRPRSLSQSGKNGVMKRQQTAGTSAALGPSSVPHVSVDLTHDSLEPLFVVMVINIQPIQLQKELTGCVCIVREQESRGEPEVDKSEVPRPGRRRMRASATSLTGEGRGAPGQQATHAIFITCCLLNNNNDTLFIY